MGFKLKIVQTGFVGTCVFLASALNAAEWKSEPSLSLRSEYNDNVRMRSDDFKEGSTGFTLDPRIKFSGEEKMLWDMSVDARAKITRYQDIEDGDSENLFFNFNGGRQTELTDWRLGANYSRNTNFDTDFDTSNPINGIGDRTVRMQASLTPSVRWSTSETTQVSLSFNVTDVTYDEVTSFRYQDYQNSSVDFNAFWRLQEKHQLGFTSSYSEYDSPDSDFSYEQTVLQLDYTYTINQISDISLSFGGRSLDSLRKNVTVACDVGGTLFPPTLGQCPSFAAPIIEDVKSSDTGMVTNLAYSFRSELTSHRFTGGRRISPSSYGGASEVRSATYNFSIKNTERFTTSFLLSASDSSTVSGTLISARNDSFTYRIEPSVSYRLTKNWNLQVRYRYLNQDYSNREDLGERASNAIYVNLFLHWPKLVTTY